MVGAGGGCDPGGVPREEAATAARMVGAGGGCDPGGAPREDAATAARIVGADGGWGPGGAPREEAATAARIAGADGGWGPGGAPREEAATAARTAVGSDGELIAPSRRVCGPSIGRIAGDASTLRLGFTAGGFRSSGRSTGSDPSPTEADTMMTRGVDPALETFESAGVESGD